MSPRFAWPMAAGALLCALALPHWSEGVAAPDRSAFAPLAPGGGPAAQPMIGEPAPGFRLPALAGGMLALEELRGKFVVLHFGASW